MRLRFWLILFNGNDNDNDSDNETMFTAKWHTVHVQKTWVKNRSSRTNIHEIYKTWQKIFLNRLEIPEFLHMVVQIGPSGYVPVMRKPAVFQALQLVEHPALWPLTMLPRPAHHTSVFNNITLNIVQILHHQPSQGIQEEIPWNLPIAMADRLKFQIPILGTIRK